jgi:hypothetical protein
MINLRSLAEQDLSQTIEAELSEPVVLISPHTGDRIDKTVGGKPLAGRVLWSHKEINPDTGVPFIVDTPVVSLRESSLPETPKSGEVWGVIIPEGPSMGAPLKNYVTDAAGIVENVRNLGYVNLFLVDAEDKAE